MVQQNSNTAEPKWKGHAGLTAYMFSYLEPMDKEKPEGLIQALTVQDDPDWDDLILY